MVPQERKVIMKTSNLILGGIQAAVLVGQIAPAFAESSMPIPDQNAINQLSLKSISESFLKVPGHCKAAGFNAQAVPLAKETSSALVQEIHDQFFA